ncbi:MAG: hypothetical protein KZQ78_10175 [Candidatus Thiodiazotropha sp. (ex Ustalcina ferruginea)]|nr:hypothetical protein [Candidatus Thiodiazotropha sp. (ex Ustalcina ferruginea)]
MACEEEGGSAADAPIKVAIEMVAIFFRDRIAAENGMHALFLMRMDDWILKHTDGFKKQTPSILTI